ncbi:SDR family NAD(P)-dependent oxidoreductase [Parasphingorhabdus sp.]|uniref:SDR family NAD(P)-dependent oxidoreductase n=1 Tax=Parasphingorhabdus sp. TaxID=2709688 RepID=UPI003BAF30AB
MKRLDGKVAIVTGGGGGIGAGVVERLISEGAKVTVADISAESAQKVADGHGDAALAVQFDAADEASVKAMVDATVARFGRLDILHNNAAMTDPAKHQADTTATDIPLYVWDETMDVNVKGYLLGCRFAIPHLIESGGGSIIHTASNSGVAGDLARIAYGTSKGAIIALSKYIATQYGKQNIRSNTVAPGVIMTEALRATTGDLPEIIKRHILTPEFGEPADVGALVAFLAADESKYITGETISISGGGLVHQPHYADLMEYMEKAMG